MLRRPVVARYFLAILLVATVASPAQAFFQKSGPAHVSIKNDTQYGAWVTVYRHAFRDIIVAAYCVKPSEDNSRFFKDAYKVMVQIEQKGDCGGGERKRMADDIDWSRGTPSYFRRVIRENAGAFSW